MLEREEKGEREWILYNQPPDPTVLSPLTLIPFPYPFVPHAHIPPFLSYTLMLDTVGQEVMGMGRGIGWKERVGWLTGGLESSFFLITRPHSLPYQLLHPHPYPFLTDYIQQEKEDERKKENP